MSYGSDFAGVSDLDPNLTFFRGEKEPLAFAQSIARRFVTQRFGLFYDPTYGLDLRSFVSDSVPTDVVEGLISIEARKDTRVRDCVASIVVQGESWDVTIEVTPQAGPSFPLTLSVDRAAVVFRGVR